MTEPNTAERIAGLMPAGRTHPEIQRAQTRHRLELVRHWGLRPGERVLEVGCGQGDMTAVLADAVGSRGHVVGVDPAGPDYGGPVPLGESRAALLASPLGARIDIRLGFDVLAQPDAFGPDAFDRIVVAHAGWYFAGLTQLAETLALVRRWSPRLAVAEWDLQVSTPGQLPHLLAVLVQAQVEAHGSRGTGNVRTPFSRQQLLRAAADAGWRVAGVSTVDTAGLQDADWEIAAARDMLADAARLAPLPTAVRDLVRGECDTLDAIAEPQRNAALDAYAITFDRVATADPT